MGRSRWFWGRKGIKCIVKFITFLDENRRVTSVGLQTRIPKIPALLAQVRQREEREIVPSPTTEMRRLETEKTLT
jgi:hypothetical protein